MKRTFTIIGGMMLLAACSGENSIIDPSLDKGASAGASIRVELEEPVGVGDEDFTRSSLVLNEAKNIMAFRWDDDDCIGTFTYPDAEHSQQMKFSQVPSATDTDTERTYQTPDGDLVVEPTKQYISCLPYFEGHPFNYTNIPVDYTGQRQTMPADFTDYKKSPDTGYQASLPNASAHLSQYDYLCTGPVTPDERGGIFFKLNRMSSIVRMWVVLDSKYNYVYDELQLVNNSRMFTTKATLNAATMTLTPTEQSHVVSLKLGNEGEGFDLTDKPADGTSSTFYYWNNGKHSGSIMTFMMFAPIDLTADNVEKCFAYLVAHEKDHPENKHYFRSAGLSKPNLRPNSYYKWNVTPAVDTPIEMTGITVEEWREGTSFDNEGTGTGKW